VAGRVYLAI